MTPVMIDERLSVCGQIGAKDVAMIAASGFTALINNRPDGESFGQPKASAIAEAAANAGLRCAHIPVRGRDITEESVRQFRQTLADSDGPVLAFCRSGARSLTLWAIGQVLDGRMTEDDLIRYGAERGFDLSTAVAWITANGRRPSPGNAGKRNSRKDTVCL